ncbi:MAG: Ig-like domain-containing protein [Armatimonadota bacterium]
MKMCATALQNRYVRGVLVLCATYVAVCGYVRAALWWQAEHEQATEVSLTTEELAGMADVRVAGAGDATFNGDYTQAGTYNGKPYYTFSGTGGTRYLFWQGGLWALGGELTEDMYEYHGTGDDLPANPWHVGPGIGAEPPPTLTLIAQEEDSPPDGDLIDALPVVAQKALLEALSADQYVVVAWTDDQRADVWKYDGQTGEWTAGATPPAALQSALNADSVLLGDKVYVAARPMAVQTQVWLWEYDPTGDTWTQRGAYTPENMRIGSPLHLVVASSDLYVIVTLSDLGDQARWGGLAISRADWSAAALAVGGVNIADVRSEDTALAAAAIPGDTCTLRVLTATGRTYGYTGSAWQAGPMSWGLSIHSLSGHASAVMPNTAAWYVWDRQGRQPSRAHAAEAFGDTSYNAAGLLDVAAEGSTLYALHNPDYWSNTVLRRWSTRPHTPDVDVVVAGDDATVSWTFEDLDLPSDAQSAYRVIVRTDAGGLVHDSGKTAGSADSLLLESLPTDGYSAEVTVWDEDDQASATGRGNFWVGGAPPGDNPPTVAITQPLPSATITGDQEITVEASDDNGVTLVRILVDGAELAALTAPNDGDDYSALWLIAGYPNGQRTITAVATDTAGQTTTTSITVTLNAGGDTDPPTVIINSPGSGATISSDCTINATANDNVAVARVRFYVDGQLQADLTAPNAGTNYEATWAVSGWANGSHTIRVTAADTAGNIGYAERTVTLDRSKALLTKYLYTEKMPIGAVADLWRTGVAFTRGLLTVSLREQVPTDPLETYQVSVGVNVPGDSVDFASYQVIDPDHVHGFNVQGSTVRWALRAAPTMVIGYWQLSATTAVRLVPMPSGPPALLADTSVWRLVGGDWQEWEPLADLSVAYDAAYFDGKILVAGDKLVAKDVDTGELSWPLALPSATAYRAVATGGSVAYVAVDTAGGSHLYAFSWDATQHLAPLPASARRIVAASGIAAIGCADGRLQRWSGGALTEVVSTGEAAVYSILQAGDTLYLGTGGDGEVWVSAPSWALDSALGTGDVRALADWQTALYAAGVDAGKLWRRTASGWAHWHTLPDYTQVRDLLVVDGALWVAGETATGVRISRLEMSEGGQFVCGAEPPDILAKIVDARPA